ncbi:hypothetical protein EJB05_54301, partial [Eragrostis curvula]
MALVFAQVRAGGGGGGGAVAGDGAVQGAVWILSNVALGAAAAVVGMMAVVLYTTRSSPAAAHAPTCSSTVPGSRGGYPPRPRTSAGNPLSAVRVVAAAPPPRPLRIFPAVMHALPRIRRTVRPYLPAPAAIGTRPLTVPPAPGGAACAAARLVARGVAA